MVKQAGNKFLSNGTEEEIKIVFGYCYKFIATKIMNKECCKLIDT